VKLLLSCKENSEDDKRFNEFEMTLPKHGTQDPLITRYLLPVTIFLLYLHRKKTMEVIYTAAQLAASMATLRTDGQSIGFVPTMGALHDGHLSLVHKSKQQNNYTVVSIFVNPTQFNDKNDLKKYPRMPERDLGMLKEAACNMVFIPDEKEIYPKPDTRVFDFGGLDRVMEGKQRPGHFNGVAQVVTRLFDLVKPHRAYFGLKDYQQLAIIRKVTADLQYPVDIIACPIIREEDGLAMSSRNMLLGIEERKRALVLYRSLFMAKELSNRFSPAEIKQQVTKLFYALDGLELEYFEIVHGSTLLPVSHWKQDADVIGCIAARLGKIRLIDNINFSS
jgi:pantoate--beta-alanine ligase